MCRDTGRQVRAPATAPPSVDVVLERPDTPDAAAPPVRILLVSGSTRAASTNTAVLRTAPTVAPEGVTTELYEIGRAHV